MSTPAPGRSAAPARRTLLRGAALLPFLAATAGCGLGSRVLHPDTTVRVAVPWSAAELAAFRRMLADLDDLPTFETTPQEYTVEVVPLGDDIPAALPARGASRADVLMLQYPGLVAENRDVLEPLPDDWSVTDTYAPIWQRLLCFPDPDTGLTRPYGLPFKFAHKSLVWYRRCLFDSLRLEPPTSWQEWLHVNATLADAGVAPLAIGGADGWMLTDFFENTLLGYAPCAYDMLGGETSRPADEATPRPWDHPAVRETFRLLGQMWGAPGALAGGVRGSLVQQFPDAMLEVFRYHRAAMVVAPDFAEPIVRRFGSAPDGCSDDVGVFAFPAVEEDAEPPLVAGGDVAVLVRPATEEAKDFIRRLAHPRATESWVASGGFIPANRHTRHIYSADIEPFATQLGTSAFRFDLSDQLGQVGGQEGLWRVLQDFLAQVGDGHVAETDHATDEAVRRLIELEDATVDDATLRGQRHQARAATAREAACAPGQDR